MAGLAERFYQISAYIADPSFQLLGANDKAYWVAERQRLKTYLHLGLIVLHSTVRRIERLRARTEVASGRHARVKRTRD